MGEHSRHPLVARLFHWATVLLVLTMVPAGIAMTRISGGALQNTLFDFHRSVGFLLLVVTVLRLLFRASYRMTPLPSEMPMVQRAAAKAVHVLLYVCMIVNPIVGWVATSAYGAAIPVFGLFTLPTLVDRNRELAATLFEFHEVLGIVFIAAIVLHVGAAALHALVIRDDVHKRMV